MANPLFWLVVSLVLVTVSLTTVLLVAVPTLRELSRAARSAEKLFDTLDRQLPPTLEAIRRTGAEITELADEVGEGVQSASRVVEQMDRSLQTARQQAQVVHRGSRSLWAGVRVAWQVWWGQGQSPPPRPKKFGHQRSRLTDSSPPDPGQAEPKFPRSRPNPKALPLDWKVEGKNSDGKNLEGENPELPFPQPKTNPRAEVHLDLEADPWS